MFFRKDQVTFLQIIEQTKFVQTFSSRSKISTENGCSVVKQVSGFNLKATYKKPKL